MSSKKTLRTQLFVDPKVQGALVWRAILYWFTCLVAMALLLLCWRILTGPARVFYHHFDAMWFYYGPALLVSLVILPVVIVDIIRVSNRFAGPMLRLRRSMRAFARGEHVEPVKFRIDDFWHDFAKDFNAVTARVQGNIYTEPDDAVFGSHKDHSDVSIADSDEEDRPLEAVGSQGK